MIDVGGKKLTVREATAEAEIKISKNSIEMIKNKNVPKGDVLEISRIAGIMAAKKTSEFVPLCHQISLDWVSIDFTFDEGKITIRSKVKAKWKTGVEMESLISCAISAITIYDMLKAFDNEMEITSIKLLEKKGGKTNFKRK
ncbi:MAG: cyclic pyranopterin monophosphate synthase MoaC [Acidobacteriota bacterium]